MRNRLLTFLKDRTATDAQTCRTCGMLFLAIAITIVLPPVLINLLMGGKVLKRVVDLLTGKIDSIVLDVLGPMLVTFFLPAIIAAILGVALLLGTVDRRRCGKLLFWYVGFSIFMLVWPFVPTPWIAMRINPAYASRLRTFTFTSILGLVAMEGYAVIPHMFAIVLLWGLSLFIGWSAMRQNTVAGEPLG